VREQRVTICFDGMRGWRQGETKRRWRCGVAGAERRTAWLGRMKKCHRQHGGSAYERRVRALLARGAHINACVRSTVSSFAARYVAWT